MSERSTGREENHVHVVLVDVEGRDQQDLRARSEDVKAWYPLRRKAQLVVKARVPRYEDQKHRSGTP